MSEVLTPAAPPRAGGIGKRSEFTALNAQLNLLSESGGLQLEKDQEALRAYLQQEIAPKTKTFPDLATRLEWLIDNHYYDAGCFGRYSSEFIAELYHDAARIDHGFSTFLGAFKFFNAYALKSFDGSCYLEDYTDRVIATALLLGNGDTKLAKQLTEEMLTGRFQPATPTFLNAGKAQRGELVSCFLLRLEDNMESVGRAVNSSLQLSKRGGGVALLLTNLREMGAPIKRIHNQAAGVVPVMKILEDAFSYANQLGARQGAGAVYLNAHHPDILRFLDTKRENADEKIRIKTLSLGVVIPDVTFQLAKENQPMHLFSPYDIQQEYGVPMSDISITDMYDELLANPRISKTQISARDFFRTLAELQFESGYPYIVFEDTVNRANPIAGRVNMSNLCSEILQSNTPSLYGPAGEYLVTGHDISCNLGSLNIAEAMASSDFAATVTTAIRALTSVSEQTAIAAVPSVQEGNNASHAIGLGQMNLHGYLASQRIRYGSPEALEFVSCYFMLVNYHALQASNELAIERGKTFDGFSESRYADGSYFAQYLSRSWLPELPRVAELFAGAQITLPTVDDWRALAESVKQHGLYNAYLQAVAPTGSISYINHATASLLPITAKIEIRKEGKLGRVYYPAPHLAEDNLEYFEDAYEIGPEKIIDTYAAATPHVDQGLSLTLFFRDTATTRDINRAQIYAWRKGIKTIYYVRLRQQALTGTEIAGCVSCEL
ncbi:class 1b ribonucleoside-diphosphate reductase subunit alpha [Leucobacter sp. OH1287]|uniref:class 1b ribonucleoside-diphosphate reductase subunit alpha n=1 Tax=Leucobacter sp. OH1287 TaxID=2491049 RepID=UPI000F5F3883|nr:class 1b ribonucleoside-diphosphate reductase subunit alpha [Leucobacter sp. OH1287]RRD60870.1 class 1b ribonucleoside-diphosphate reductase subunit alpha [Leucobacter sp. OH1287]